MSESTYTVGFDGILVRAKEEMTGEEFADLLCDLKERIIAAEIQIDDQPDTDILPDTGNPVG